MQQTHLPKFSVPSTIAMLLLGQLAVLVWCENVNWTDKTSARCQTSSVPCGAHILSPAQCPSSSCAFLRCLLWSWILLSGHLGLLAGHSSQICSHIASSTPTQRGHRRVCKDRSSQVCRRSEEHECSSRISQFIWESTAEKVGGGGHLLHDVIIFLQLWHPVREELHGGCTLKHKQEIQGHHDTLAQMVQHCHTFT